MIRLYRQQRPDIVHHISIKPVLYGSFAARLTRVPWIVNALTGLGYVFVSKDFLARLLRPLVRGAFRLLLNRGNSRAVLQNHDDVRLLTAAGALEEKYVVVIRGSGVDLERFTPRPEPEEPPVILLASRMLRDKGLAEFVEAARALREAGEDVRFVLVGDSDPENPASVSDAQLAHWCDEQTVEWWGRREDMPNVLAQAHVVCLPSYREGLPKVLLEAAAVGRALVATDVPGCREIVRNGDNGLLVPVRDAKALAWAFRELISKPKQRRRMGVRSREIACAEFSIQRVVAATLAVYEGLLSR